MQGKPTDSLSLPAPLVAVLQEHDARTDDFDEPELSFFLERRLKECGEISECQRKASAAEIVALQVSLRGGQKNSPWGTRFGPMITTTREDATRYSFPDIANVDEPVVQYWSQRAKEVRHPVLKARYADVLWNLTKPATGRKPSIEMARQAIDAYIECGQRFPNTHYAEERLEQTLELALSVGDKTRTGRAVDAMFQLVDRTEYPGSRLNWLFDVVYGRKGVELTEVQQTKLIDSLAAELQRICGSPNPVGIVAKEPALRLAKHYERLGQSEDAKRVVRRYGEAVAAFAEDALGLVAMDWLQEVYATYLHYGLKTEAEQFQIAAKQKGEEATRQMVLCSQSVEIPKEQMEQFLDEMTEGDLEATLTRIAVNFCPRLDETREQLEHMKANMDLRSMVEQAKIGENQVVARAGSIDSDPEGRLMFQMADNLKSMAGVLGIVMDRVRTKFDFSTATILPFLFQSPLFEPKRRPLFEHAINAYIHGDHVAAIHVLVPQVEHALRRLLSILGKPTNKHWRSDPTVMVEKSLNDILEGEPVMQQCHGEDVTMYLRVFLCDARGFNVRNDLAHGLMEPHQFNRLISDRLLHIIVVLAHFRVPEERPSNRGDDHSDGDETDVHSS